MAAVSGKVVKGLSMRIVVFAKINWINKVANCCAVSTKAPNGILTLYFRLECSCVKKRNI